MEPLDDLLRGYAREELPSPQDVTKSVWSEINQRQTEKRRFLSWGDFFAEPQFAAAGLLLAVFIGIAPGVVRERPNARLQHARASLHLDVFSPRSLALRAPLFQPAAITSLKR